MARVKKLSALVTIGAAVVLLSGCSEQASALAACGQVAAQAVQVSGAAEALSSPTPEAAQAALDEIGGVVEKIREIDGPADFITLRDTWATSIDSFVAEGKEAIAGAPDGVQAAADEMRVATEAIVGYCTP